MQEFYPYLALEGPARSGKTALLVERALTLLETEPSDSILVICSNYFRKNQFLEAVQARREGCTSQLQVTTYSALVRNTLLQFWPLVEEVLARKKVGGKAVIFPELTGFEASEYLLKKLFDGFRQRDEGFFKDFQGSPRGLIGQMIRRLRLRSENQLSRDEMRQRSEMIGEACVSEVDKLLSDYERWCYRLRVLDNSKQIDIFQGLLIQSDTMRHSFTDRIRHMIVDDVDETIPAQQNFVKFMVPFLSTFAMAADLQGGTRRGYLNAYPHDWPGLKAIHSKMHTMVLTRNDVLYKAAEQLRYNWTGESTQVLPVTNEIQWRAREMGRLEMLGRLVQDIIDLLLAGRKPGEMVIVMPKVDLLFRLQLQKELKKRGLPLQILTGTDRPTDNGTCRSMLHLLQLANRTVWQMPLSPMEFKGLLCQGLKLDYIDPNGLEQLIQTYRESFIRGGFSFLPPDDGLNDEAKARYERLRQWLDVVAERPLEEQFYSAFTEIISPYLSPDDALSDIHQLIRSFYIKDVALMLSRESEPVMAAREWFLQIKTGAVSDTPSKPNEVDPDAIVLGTPQKVIDFEIERSLHFWLDIYSREWARTDNAPLYNAWVHSVNWDGDTAQASDEFNQMLTRVRAAHITRTLMMYVGERVGLYASEQDDEGKMQVGVFKDALILPEPKGKLAVKRAMLREDQQPILNYQGGPMAITAVPGAGKTFVNVELILTLVERGIAPNQILVLTYMDSAAKTLLMRVRAKLGGTGDQLPTVSTIHSLAYRILTEDDHALYLGLDTSDFEIMDDLTQRDVVQQILRAIQPEENPWLDEGAVIGGLRTAYSYHVTPQQLAEFVTQNRIEGRLKEFLHAFQQYDAWTRQNGRFDFTQLIVKAIELLETQPEVRVKYQERFKIVIEDEAQDSSLLLQRFIGLLTETHGNLIRTGDTNQSITTTFSSAETVVFRNFIEHSNEHGQVVAMNASGRCAPEVISLANRFMQWGKTDEVLRNAFQPMIMKPVPGFNPTLLEPIACHVFDQDTEEVSWLVAKIKQAQRQSGPLSVAILTRSNQEVQRLTLACQEAGVKAIGFSETIHLNPVFMTILYVLKILENPLEQTRLRSLVNTLATALGWQHLPKAEEPLPGNIFALEGEEIAHPDLLQLSYNLQELTRYAYGQDMCHLIVRLTDLFFTQPQDRSMGYIAAIKAQEWVTSRGDIADWEQSPLEYVLQQCDRYVQRNRLSFKSIQDTGELTEAIRNQFVQVMTLHKAKGQEFDLVFMPGMTEDAFSSKPESAKMRAGDKLELELDCIRQGMSLSQQKELEAQKRLQKVEEEARLIYVGLTRAKRALFLSCPLKGKNHFGRVQNLAPSRFFEVLNFLLMQTPTSTGEATYA